jgi:hypothetical protein
MTRARGAQRTVLAVCLLAGLSWMLAGCGTAAIPRAYTQDELKAICESRGGRWHDGDPLRGFCEYRSPG